MKLLQFYTALAEMVGMSEVKGKLVGVNKKPMLKNSTALILPTPDAIDKVVSEGGVLYTPSRESLTGSPSVTLGLTVAQASLKTGLMIKDVVNEALSIIASDGDKDVKASVAATKVVTIKGSAKSYSDVSKVLEKATATNRAYLLQYVLAEKNEGADNIYYRRIVAVTSPLLQMVDNKIKTYKRSIGKRVGPEILGVKLSKKGLEVLGEILHNVLDPILEEPAGSDNPIAPYTEALLLKMQTAFLALNNLAGTGDIKVKLSEELTRLHTLLTFMKKPGFKKQMYSVTNTEGNLSQMKNNEINKVSLDKPKEAKRKKPKKKPVVKKTKTKKQKVRSKKKTVEDKIHVEIPTVQQPQQQQSIFNRGQQSMQYSNPYNSQPTASIGARRIPVSGVTKSSPREPSTPEVDSTNFQQPQQQQNFRHPGNNQQTATPMDEFGIPLSGKALKKWKKRRRAIMRELKHKMRRKVELEEELAELNQLFAQWSKSPDMAQLMQGSNYNAPPQQPQWRGNQPRRGPSPYGTGNGYNMNAPQWGGNPPPPQWGNNPPPPPPPAWGANPPPPPQQPWGAQQAPQWGNQPPPPQQPWGGQVQNAPWGQQQQGQPWGQPQPQQPGIIMPMGSKFNTAPPNVNPNMVKQTPMGGTSNSGTNWKVGS